MENKSQLSFGVGGVQAFAGYESLLFSLFVGLYILSQSNSMQISSLFTDRKPYSALKFDPHHFCMFQEPPCRRTECRVATHIIAGLFPLNFSKFLIKVYEPLNEDERKELTNIKNFYFASLLQRYQDDKALIPQMHELPNLDDADYSEFSDVVSTFAECYLIDIGAPVPVQEILYSCFIIENNDIELNMYWLECIYMCRAGDNSPIKALENDPKLMEIQLRIYMDQIGVNGVKSHSELTEREKNLLTALKWSPDIRRCPDGITETLGFANYKEKCAGQPVWKIAKRSTISIGKSDSSTRLKNATQSSSDHSSTTSDSMSARKISGDYEALLKILNSEPKSFKDLMKDHHHAKQQNNPSTTTKIKTTTSTNSTITTASSISTTAASVKTTITKTTTTVSATDKDESLTDFAVKKKLNQ